MKKLVYILSEPRSGSTALEYVLSTHPDFVSLGEIKLLDSFLRKDPSLYISQGRCTCGTPALKCNFWSEIIENSCATLGIPAHEIKTNIQKNCSHDRPSISKNLTTILETVNRLEKRIISDSSKSLEHLEVLVESLKDWDIKVIHLLRDPLEVSKSKNKWHQKKTGKSVPLIYLVYKWFFLNLKMKRYLQKKHQIKSLQIKYEDFIAEPEKHFSLLGDFIGVSNKFKNKCDLRKTHTIAGTPSRFDHAFFHLKSTPQTNQSGTKSSAIIAPIISRLYKHF